MPVASTGLIHAAAEYLTTAAPCTHGYRVGEAPELPADLAAGEEFYVVVYPISNTPTTNPYQSDAGLSVIVFQTTIVAGTRYQCDRQADRIIRSLMVDSDISASDDGVAARFMSIETVGGTFTQDPSEHLHTKAIRFRAEATTQPT